VAIVVLGAILGMRDAACMIARGTMQKRHMQAALGVNPPLSMPSPSVSAPACRALAGAVLGRFRRLPTIGVAYVAKSFLTVIGGRRGDTLR